MTWKRGWRASERVGCQGFDDLLKGNVLLPVGLQVKGANPCEQLPKGGIPRDVRAQDQRVDEEANRGSRRLPRRARQWEQPIGMSSPAPSRDSSAAKPACRTMNRLAPLACANSVRRRCSPASRHGSPPPPPDSWHHRRPHAGRRAG